MKKRITFLLLLVLISTIIAFIFVYYSQVEIVVPRNSFYLTINNIKIDLSIADTPLKQTQGLSYQKNLEKNVGMLFIFPDKRVRNFWMKNMNFSLDIIWIDDNKIVKIDTNLLPEGEQPKNSYSSILPIDHVLEVNAGFCKSNKIYVGDTVQYYLQK